MPEYDYIDKSIPGLVQGLDYEIDGRFVAAEAINFGVAVFGYIGEDSKVGVYHLDVGKLVYDADLITGNNIDVTVNGQAITTVVWATSHLDTMNAIVAAIAGLTGVEAILDPADGTNRTILIRTKFADATVSSVVTGGASQAGTTVTYHSGQVFLGASTFVQKTPTGYELYDAVNVLRRGMVSVVPIADVKSLDKAYVDNAGGDKGSWSNAGLEINAKYLENATASGSTVLEIYDGKTYETYAESF
jgi:hypothetical protein